MRKLIIASALAGALAAPAFADHHEGTTLTAVTTHGVVLSMQGMEIPINYAEDGTFSGEAMGTPFEGTWRIDGANLCTTSDFQPDESCTEYPEGKGAGDEFTISGDAGEVTIKINE